MTADEVRALLEPMLRGPAKPYSWARQNYNGGWDQAIHHVARKLLGRPDTDPSPLAQPTTTRRHAKP